MGEVIHAFGTIEAWIEGIRAEGDLALAQFTRESCRTGACVHFHPIYACPIVLTLVLSTVIDVAFASCSSISWNALAAKSTLLQHRTRGIVPTGIAIASINHIFTVLTMIPRRTSTLILTLRKWMTLGIIVAGKCVACIALGQNVIADTTTTHKIAGRGGKEQFITHRLRFSTSGYSWLYIV